MAVIEDPTVQPLTGDRTPAAVDSQRDSVNESLEGASDHSCADKPASLHSGNRSDGLAGKDEQPPDPQTEQIDLIPFSLDDQENDADQGAFPESQVFPAAGSLERVTSIARTDPCWKDAPAHLKLREFLKSVKGKLLASKKRFQKRSHELVESGSGGLHSRDPVHGSPPDPFVLTSPVLSSPLRHSTSAAVSDTAASLVTITSQSFTTPIRLPSTRPPASNLSFASTMPFTSSPFVSSCVETRDFLETALESAPEYEKLLDETLCYIEQVVCQQRLKKEETPQLDTVACGPGPGGVNRFEETEEVTSLRQTEKQLREKVRELEDKLNIKDYKLGRLEKENDSLSELSKSVLSSEEQQEISREKLDSLHKKLRDERSQRDSAEMALHLEREKFELCRQKLTNTQRDLRETNNRLVDYEIIVGKQHEDLTEKDIQLEEKKLQISQLRSFLDNTTLNWTGSKDTLEKEIKRHGEEEMQLIVETNRLSKAEQAFKRIIDYILMLDTQDQGDYPTELTHSDSYEEWAKYVIDTLQTNGNEFKLCKDSFKLIETGEANMLDTVKKLEITVKELRKEIDENKEKLEHLQTSISACVHVMQKLKLHRINEVNSLNELLIWLCSYSNDFDASDSERTKSSLSEKFQLCQSDFRASLDELLSKLNTIVPVGLHNLDDSIYAGRSSMVNCSSFRDEQESIVDDPSERSSTAHAEQSAAFEAIDKVTLKEIDSTLLSSLNILFQLELTRSIRRPALVPGAILETDIFPKSKNEFEVKMQKMARDHSIQFEALQKQFNDSERELIVVKKQLNDLSSGIITVVGKTADSETIRDFQVDEDVPSDECFVKISLASLRLLCRDVLEIDGEGAIQLCDLLQCCSIALNEYEKIRKELSSLRKENKIARQQIGDETRSKDTELEMNKNQINKLSRTLAQLSKDTVACTASLRAVRPRSGSLNSSKVKWLQASATSNNFEKIFSRLSNSVESLIATVEQSILDFNDLKKEKNIVDKTNCNLHVEVDRVTSVVKKLKDELKHQKYKRRQALLDHKTVVRDFNKRLEDKTTRVQTLQEKLERLQDLIESEETSMRQQLEEIAVMKANSIKHELRITNVIAAIQDSSAGSQGASDPTHLDQDRSVAYQRDDSSAGASRDPPPSDNGNTRKNMAAIQEGSSERTGGATRAGQQGSLPMPGTGSSRVLSSRQKPSHRNAPRSPVTRIELGESLNHQLGAAPGSSMPRFSTAPFPASIDPVEPPGPSRTTTTTTHRRGGKAHLQSPRPNNADDGRCPRGPDSLEGLPDAGAWMPTLVLCCVSSFAVVWYFYSKQPFI